MKKKYLLAVGILLAVFVGGMVVEHQVFAAPPQDSVDTTDLPRTLFMVKTKHVRTDVKDSALFYGSIKGVVAALNDPYSRFLTPEEAKAYLESSSGKYAGIGMEFGLKEGRMVVGRAMPNSPAQKAGIETNDEIIEVDGVSAAKRPLDEVVMSIRGVKGTSVTLTIKRPGVEELKKFTIVRDNIVSVPLTTKILKSGKKSFMHIELSTFNEEGERLFLLAAKEVVALKLDGVILDLRNNGGGMLVTAQTLACSWINDAPMLITEHRGEDPQVMACEHRAKLQRVPTVVLVNEHSASASEITAGALQDSRKATVIGEQTFGKGCGQLVLPYPDGSLLILTNFYWKTPSGRTIDKVGITPDIVVPGDEKDIAAGKDVQLEQAVETLSKKR